MKRGKLVFLVKSAEQSFCPCCGNELKVAGSRQRKYIDISGDQHVIIIRRLKCFSCRKIHHELPDMLVPYKHYDSESIESVITNSSPLAVAADNSTISRWRAWINSLKRYILGCLLSIAIRSERKSVDGISCRQISVLEGIWQYTGKEEGWLKKAVRTLANSNLWIHTRFAFLST